MDIILFTLVYTHITILCITLFLHRSQAHRSVTFGGIAMELLDITAIILVAVVFWLVGKNYTTIITSILDLQD